jgi:hypothetical protein
MVTLFSRETLSNELIVLQSKACMKGWPIPKRPSRHLSYCPSTKNLTSL